MKKSKLSITLMAALLGVGALAGCDNNPVKPSPKGIIVSYTVNGKNGEITADDILVKYYQDSTKYESIFNAIKSVVIKNYFEVNEDVIDRGTGTKITAGLSDVDALKVEARGRVESEKITAETNAHTNKTSFKKEMSKIFEANGVENEKQLEEKFLNEEKEKKFTKNMEEFHMAEMRDGYARPTEETANTKILSNEDETKLEEMWTGYLKDMLPYHVSHLLVNIEDSSEKNYHNATISEANCEKLYNVVESLSAGKNFNMLAKEYSDDTGSKVDHGALGLMDYSTSYIDEFKLGLYAYEELYGKNTGRGKIKIAIPGDQINDQVHTNFVDEFKESSGIADLNSIPTIDKSVFKQLKEVAKQEKSVFKAGEVEYQESVMGGSSFAFPRNIIFNKELNKHSFAFITEAEAEYTAAKDIADTAFEVGTAGFHKYTETENAKLYNKGPILSVKGKNEIRPIIVVRGGTAGDSGYQGIHFIVVNRDPFEDDSNAADYYSVVRQDEANFIPGTQADTYVNYKVENNNEEFGKRITNLEDKFKGYDSDRWDKFVVRKYMMKNGLTIADELLNYELNRWIDNTIEVAKHKEERSRVQKWRDYTKVLEKQNKDRKDLMPEMARIGFDMSINAPIAKNSAIITSSSPLEDSELNTKMVFLDAAYTGHEVDGKKSDVSDAEDALAAAIAAGTGIEAAQVVLEKAKEDLRKAAIRSFQNYAAYIGLSAAEFDTFKTAVTKAIAAKAITNPGEDLKLSDLYDMKGAIFNNEK